MGKYISKDNTKLYDNRILKDLEKAIHMYENGELLETADMLQNIADAIRSWKPETETY